VPIPATVHAMERTETAAELAAEFAQDGVVCVRSALDPAEVAVAERAIDAVLARPGPLAQVASGPRRWATSPLFPGLDPELAGGAVLDHPLFPVVWP
jgi:hypothetical protein